MSSQILHQTGEPSRTEEVDGWWTRDRALVLVLAALTVLFVWLCYRLLQPFLPSLAWAVALAVVAHPLHTWIRRRISKPGVASGLSVTLVAVAIIAPAGWVGHQVGREAGRILQTVQSGEAQKRWDEMLKKHPQLAPAQQWAQQQLAAGAPLQNSLGTLGTVVTGSFGVVIELLVTLFFLFFLFRDQKAALDTVRSLVPLSERETDEVFTRVGDTIYASIYGTLSVAAIQGVLGGLMFWWLGLPAPLLWGLVMGILSIVPVLGAFVVWIPAAIFLATTGSWGKALILTGWGTLVVGLIDNLLYPIFVGERLRLHTAAVFVAIVGGLAVFGASGVILGPVILALTSALVDIWRRRTRYGRPAEQTLAANRPKAHTQSLSSG